MVTIADVVEDPIELRKAGIKALTTALGYEATQAFLSQSFGGAGDWTQDRHNLPELGFERLTAELEQFDEEAFLRKHVSDLMTERYERQTVTAGAL